jgi:hypothetical protein
VYAREDVNFMNSLSSASAVKILDTYCTVQFDKMVYNGVMVAVCTICLLFPSLVITSEADVLLNFVTWQS